MLAFADDIVLIAASPRELQLLVDKFVQFCQQNALAVNITKTKAMFVNCKGNIVINEKEIEIVDYFKQLGFNISNACMSPVSILEDRIIKANRMFQAIRTNCRLLGLSNIRIKI